MGREEEADSVKSSKEVREWELRENAAFNTQKAEWFKEKVVSQ